VTGTTCGLTTTGAGVLGAGATFAGAGDALLLLLPFTAR